MVSGGTWHFIRGLDNPLETMLYYLTLISFRSGYRLIRSVVTYSYPLYFTEVLRLVCIYTIRPTIRIVGNV